MSTGEFVELNKENEHILVCLSSSPSNEKIIRTAAKMARDMRARFTALYVQTGKRERESDKRRLEAHVQFAKESGVIPNVKPTVPTADAASNRQLESGSPSYTLIVIPPAKNKIKYIIAIVAAFFITPTSILLPNAVTSSRL